MKAPPVVWRLTTKRVLTMAWVDGCRVDDVAALEASGLDPKKVGHALVGALATLRG